jgi:hypothetical protein
MEYFENMLAVAKEKNQSLIGEYAQTVVALTVDDKIFSLPLSNALDLQSLETELFLQSLEKNENRPIARLLCLWTTGEIDLPSMALRRALIKQNPLNGEAQVFVLRETGYACRSLNSTMS